MNNVYDSPEWLAFVEAINKNPGDKVAVQMAADWLEEHGEHTQADFMRVTWGMGIFFRPPNPT